MILYQPHHFFIVYLICCDHCGVVAGDFCVRNSCPTWPATAPCRKRGRKSWENRGKPGKSLGRPQKWSFIVEENMELPSGDVKIAIENGH